MEESEQIDRRKRQRDLAVDDVAFYVFKKKVYNQETHWTTGKKSLQHNQSFSWERFSSKYQRHTTTNKFNPLDAHSRNTLALWFIVIYKIFLYSLINFMLSELFICINGTLCVCMRACNV